MNKYFIFIIFLIFSCLISAISQVLLKKSAQKQYNSFFKQYFNAYVIIAYLLFFIVVFANTYILRIIPMTIVNPIAETLPYIFSIIFGFFFFNEKITIRKILGSIIIIFGIIVLII